MTGNATETTQCAPSRPSLGIKGLLLIGVGLLASGWMGWVTLRGQAAHADRPVVAGEWLKVERGDFEVVCREDGELKPVKVTTIGFTDWGRVAWLIPEGSRVAKGDKIVSIETDRLEDDIQQIQDDLATAERNLAQLEQTQELDRKQWETTMLAEKDRLELARLKEKQILDKPDELDKKDADNKLKGAQARVAAAKADFEALTPLVERGFANRADVEAKELALKLAECELQRATLEVQDILDGATSEERRKAALDRTNAEAAFRLKELDRDQQLVNNAFQVRGSQHQVEQLQQRLARRKKNLEDSTRMAPHEGIVVYRTVGWDGNKKVSIGDHVGPWMSPVDLPSYDKMKVRTQVPESVVRYLHARSEGEGGKAVAGSEARVRVKTLPGKIYPAEVTWIDGWARDRNAKLSEADIKNKGLSGVRVFDVEVELKASDPERLRDGFRAMVEFPLETLTSVIAIPAHAVKTTGTQATVQVNTKGAPEIRPVTLGKESNGRIVILTGLSEGEKVLVPPMPAEVEEDASAAAMGTGTGPAAGKDGGGVSAPGGGGARTPGGAGGPGGGGMRSGGASGGGGGGSSGGRKGRSK